MPPHELIPGSVSHSCLAHLRATAHRWDSSTRNRPDLTGASGQTRMDPVPQPTDDVLVFTKDPISRQTIRLSRWTLVLAVLLGMTACSFDRTYLPALLADPMATYEAEGIELVTAVEEGEGRDIIMDLPTHAHVWRMYRIEDQTQVASLLAEAVAYAEAQGWRMQKESDREYRGAREMEPGIGRLHLSTPAFDVLNDPDGPRGLSISLDFGPVRFDDAATTTSTS